LKPKSEENLRVRWVFFRSVIRLEREREREDYGHLNLSPTKGGSAALLTRSNPPIKKSPPHKPNPLKNPLADNLFLPPHANKSIQICFCQTVLLMI